MKKPILGILGPTAVGKSSLAITLAQKFDTEVISADSMQVFREFDIGTAKATQTEKKGVKHHLIDIVDGSEEFSSFLFKEKALEVINSMSRKNMIPIVVGGTGFFFNNLIKKFDFEHGENLSEIRQHLENLLVEKGKEFLFEKLKEVDLDSAKKLFVNDAKKVQRALEIFYTTGRRKSEGNGLKEDILPNRLYVLNEDRKTLYERINARVDQMMHLGLLDEVERLYDKFGENVQPFKGIGYKEFLPHLKGECSLKESVELVKQHSRNYAKRQITFFKKMNAVWIDSSLGIEKMIELIVNDYENYCKRLENGIM